MWKKAIHGSTVSPGVWRTCISTLPIPHPKPELHNQEIVTAETQSRTSDQKERNKQLTVKPQYFNKLIFLYIFLIEYY